MNWVVTCETPVHIGTGSELQPFEYEIRNGRYVVFDQQAALAYLAAKDARYVEDFAEYATKLLVGGRGGGSYRSRLGPSDANVAAFCEHILRRPDLAEEIRTSCVAYSGDGLGWAPRDSRRRIREAMKARSELLFPGSSLKGAIRTALAYDILVNSLNGAELQTLLDGSRGTDIQGIRRQIGDLKEGFGKAISLLKRNPAEGARALGRLAGDVRRAEKRIGETVDRFLFRWGRKDLGGISFRDPQQDLLRALSVSDSYRVKADLAVLPLTAATRRKGPQSGPPIVVEAADQGSQFEVSIGLNGRLLQRMAVAAQRDSRGEWIDFDRKFSWVFGRDPDELRNLRGQAELNEWAAQTLRDLLGRLNQHSRAVLERDKVWLRGVSGGSAKGLEEELSRLLSLVEEDILLRIGFASGWHSATVALALLKRGRKDVVADLLYVFLMDLPQNEKKRLSRPYEAQRNAAKALKLLSRTVDPTAFPASRRVIVDEEELVGWMGWVTLSERSLSVDEVSGKERVQVEEENGNEDLAELLEKLKRKFDSD